MLHICLSFYVHAHVKHLRIYKDSGAQANGKIPVLGDAPFTWLCSSATDFDSIPNVTKRKVGTWGQNGPFSPWSLFLILLIQSFTMLDYIMR